MMSLKYLIGCFGAGVGVGISAMYYSRQLELEKLDELEQQKLEQDKLEQQKPDKDIDSSDVSNDVEISLCPHGGLHSKYCRHCRGIGIVNTVNTVGTVDTMDTTDNKRI